MITFYTLYLWAGWTIQTVLTMAPTRGKKEFSWGWCHSVTVKVPTPRTNTVTNILITTLRTSPLTANHLHHLHHRHHLHHLHQKWLSILSAWDSWLAPDIPWIILGGSRVILMCAGPSGNYGGINISHTRSGPLMIKLTNLTAFYLFTRANLYKALKLKN